MPQLIDIFLQPGRVFADQREQPTFLVPLLLIAALSAAMTLGYFFSVDPAWHEAQVLAVASQDLSAKEAEQVKASIPAAETMGWLGAAGALVGVVFATLLTALYVLIASKVTGRSLTYRHGLGLSVWSSMPMVLGLLIALVGVITMAPQTSMESLMLTNVDPLLIELPADHRWNRLAQSFNLLTFWTVGLFALGWRVMTGSSWTQAIVVSVLPTLIVFGVVAALPAP